MKFTCEAMGSGFPFVGRFRLLLPSPSLSSEVTTVFDGKEPFYFQNQLDAQFVPLESAAINKLPTNFETGAKFRSAGPKQGFLSVSQLPN